MVGVQSREDSQENNKLQVCELHFKTSTQSTFSLQEVKDWISTNIPHQAVIIKFFTSRGYTYNERQETFSKP